MIAKSSFIIIKITQYSNILLNFYKIDWSFINKRVIMSIPQPVKNRKILKDWPGSRKNRTNKGLNFGVLTTRQDKLILVKKFLLFLTYNFFSRRTKTGFKYNLLTKIIAHTVVNFFVTVEKFILIQQRRYPQPCRKDFITVCACNHNRREKNSQPYVNWNKNSGKSKRM